MPYNVLSHSHWGLGQYFGGGEVVEIPGGVVKKRQSPNFRSPEVGISDNTTGNCCSVAFIWMVSLKDFIHKLKRYKYLNT